MFVAKGLRGLKNLNWWQAVACSFLLTTWLRSRPRVVPA